MKAKVSYYLSHPIQYFSPLLIEMSKEFDLHVYYFSNASVKGNVDVGFGREVKWDTPLLEGYSYTFLTKSFQKEITIQQDVGCGESRCCQNFGQR